MRALLLALSGLVTCVASAQAVPRLEAGGGTSLHSTGAAVEYRQADGDPAPSRIVFQVPSGYSFTPTANGAAVGSLVGTGVVQIAGQPQLITPALTMQAPTAFRREGVVCTGRDTHDAVWTLVFGSPGGSAEIPVFVDGRSFEICPDATRLGGTPRTLALQLGIVGGDANRPIVTGPSTRGRFVWSAVVSRAGLPDVEVRSIMEVPQTARVGATVASGRLRIAGRVTANGRGIAGVRVRVEVGKRRGIVFALGGQTRADGSFTLRHRLARGTYVVRTVTYPAQRDVTGTGCAGGSSAAGGCVSATRMIAGMAATPATIRVRATGSR